MLFQQGLWLTKEPKALKGGMQIVVAKTSEEAARAVRCDQHGMLNTSFGISTSSENEKICSAS